MSVPYMPLYISDFEADTSHLSLAEDGAYNRLLRLCWRTPGCSIPDDPEWIMRRLRVTEEEFEDVVQPVLNEFFTRSRGRLKNPRQIREHKLVLSRRKTASENGRKGGRPANPVKNKGKNKSDGLVKPKAKQNPEKSSPEPEPEPFLAAADARARAGTLIIDSIVSAAGIDPAKAVNGWMDFNVLASLNRWRDLGLGDEAICSVIQGVAKRESYRPPSSPNYFDGAMQNAAAELNRPPLTPIDGGSHDRESAGKAKHRRFGGITDAEMRREAEEGERLAERYRSRRGVSGSGD